MIASIRAMRHISTLSIRAALFALAMACTAAFGQSTADRFTGLTPRPVGTIQAHGTVAYVPPVGWSVQNGADGVTTLTGPVPNEERPCEIWMLPPMPA